MKCAMCGQCVHSQPPFPPLFLETGFYYPRHGQKTNVKADHGQQCHVYPGCDKPSFAMPGGSTAIDVQRVGKPEGESWNMKCAMCSVQCMHSQPPFPPLFLETGFYPQYGQKTNVKADHGQQRHVYSGCDKPSFAMPGGSTAIGVHQQAGEPEGELWNMKCTMCSVQCMHS